MPRAVFVRNDGQTRLADAGGSAVDLDELMQRNGRVLSVTAMAHGALVFLSHDALPKPQKIPAPKKRRRGAS